MFSNVFNRKAKENLVKEGNRLPAGQSLTDRFPVLHYGPTATYRNLDNWDLRVFGLIEEGKRCGTGPSLTQLPRTQITLDLHCVTRWSKFDTLGRGLGQDVGRRGFIQPVGSAQLVIQHCEQGYTTNTPIDLLLSDNMLMATHYDGQTTGRRSWLAVAHGDRRALPSVNWRTKHSLPLERRQMVAGV